MVLWTNYLGRDVLIQAAAAAGFTAMAGEFVWAKRSTDAAVRRSEQVGTKGVGTLLKPLP
jgi:hypothetical protein